MFLTLPICRHLLGSSSGELAEAAGGRLHYPLGAI